jgi:hypothetical protein
MDPNVFAERQGLPEDDNPAAHERASYLRRLRMETAKSLGLPSEVTGALPATVAKERRCSPRYQCTGSVEIRLKDNDARLWGNLRDISLHGCYVEMTTTFPVDTKVKLCLEAGGVRMQGEATVRATYPSLGMGMCFGELAITEQTRLKQILAAAAEKRSANAGQWRSS